jgi:hypothetical protein
MVARLYRGRDEYVLKYLPGTAVTDFVSLALPVREEPWSRPLISPLCIEHNGLKKPESG